MAISKLIRQAKKELASFAQVCKINDLFKSTCKTQKGDHLMGRTLQNLINEKCDSSMPGSACKMHANTCSMCMFKRRKRRRIAGSKLMLMKNFGTRI